MDEGVMWVPEMAKLMEVPKCNIEGEYREIRKVHLSRMKNIPTIVDLLGRSPRQPHGRKNEWNGWWKHWYAQFRILG
jgi:hypothetical protein